MYKNAIFDVDGTIIDSSEGVFGTLRYAIERLGKPPLPEEKIKLFMGPSLYDGFTKIAGYDGDEALRGIELYREKYAEDGLYRCKMFDGYPQLFERLKRAGVTLSAASTKPQIFLTPLFDHLGIAKYFDRIVGPAEESHGSDKTEFISAARTHEKAVMIGDRKYDILSARKAGVDVIGVTYGFSADGEFAEYKPDYLAKDTNEIYDIIVRTN